MIQFFVLLIILTVAYLPFRGRIFELSAGTLLIVPLAAYLIGHIAALSAVTYGALLLLTIGVVYLVVPQSNEPIRVWDLLPMIIWGYLFVAILALCYGWPDFMPNGERIRDYALLSEVMKYPVNPQEPWMSGANMNYYLYWYRFGSFIGNFLQLPTWQMYHVLQAITFSLYITTCFRILQVIAKCSIPFSLTSALVIGLGSNIAGVLYAFKGEHDAFKWWGPSRVVAGAINEFPVWSFLLGDLHPHYLNLTLIPFFALFAFTIWDSALTKEKRLTYILALTAFLFPLWVFNGNAWEVPVLGIIIGSFTLLLFIFTPIDVICDSLVACVKEVDKSILYIATIVAGGISLYLASRNISPGGDHFKLVYNSETPIKLTTIKELMLHWGLPLSMIGVSTIVLTKGIREKFLAFVAIGFCLLVQSGVALIFVLLLLNAQRILNTDRDKMDFSRLFFEALGLTSLALILIPEIVFLDDPYGGENERMNTIFKAYSADWALIHLFAFWLVMQVVNLITSQERIKTILYGAFMAPATFAMCLFFIITIGDRKSDDFHIKPIEQGLSQLDAKYPGAADAITRFQALPDGVTLESQGNPYSLTSHVATLGQKRSYLGWINHVDLLVRNYDESKRRAAITQTIYESKDCTFIKDTMKSEGIRYLVVGPLEKERFPSISIEKFSCLSKPIESQLYTIFEAQ